MKTHSFIILILLISLINCTLDKNPIISSPDSDYFPINVGNTWYYDPPTPQTNPWAMKTIKGYLVQNNTAYYSWTYGEGVDIIDNIRADEQGNIWKLHNYYEYLWFDFTQDSGSTYIYDLPESFGENIYYYAVYVRKNIKTETPAGVFDNCIEFTFDIPQVTDEDKTYTFAPNIGLVRLQNNGWSSQRLTSAIINSASIGN